MPRFLAREHHPSRRKYSARWPESWRIVLARMLLAVIATACFYLNTVHRLAFRMNVLKLSEDDGLIPGFVTTLRIYRRAEARQVAAQTELPSGTRASMIAR